MEDDEDDERAIGTFRIVNGLVSYVQTGLSILQSRSEEQDDAIVVVSEQAADDAIPRASSMDEEEGGRQEESTRMNEREGNDDLTTRASSQNNRRRNNRLYQSVEGTDAGKISVDMDSTTTAPNGLMDQVGSDEELGSEHSRKKNRKVGRKKYRPISDGGAAGEEEENVWIDDNESGIDDRFVISDSDD